MQQYSSEELPWTRPGMKNSRLHGGRMTCIGKAKVVYMQVQLSLNLPTYSEPTKSQQRCHLGHIACFHAWDKQDAYGLQVCCPPSGHASGYRALKSSRGSPPLCEPTIIYHHHIHPPLRYRSRRAFPHAANSNGQKSAPLLIKSGWFPQRNNRKVFVSPCTVADFISYLELRGPFLSTFAIKICQVKRHSPKLRLPSASLSWMLLGWPRLWPSPGGLRDSFCAGWLQFF